MKHSSSFIAYNYKAHSLICSWPSWWSPLHCFLTDVISSYMALIWCLTIAAKCSMELMKLSKVRSYVAEMIWKVISLSFSFSKLLWPVVKTGSIQLWKKNLHPQSLSGTKPSSFLFYRSVTEVLSHLSPDLCVVSCASLDLDNQAACHHTSLTLTTVCLVWTAGYGNLLDFYGSNWLSGSNMWKEEVVLSSLRG